MRTHFARPNWKEVFTKIASKHPNSTIGNKLLAKIAELFPSNYNIALAITIATYDKEEIETMTRRLN